MGQLSPGGAPHSTVMGGSTGAVPDGEGSTAAGGGEGARAVPRAHRQPGPAVLGRRCRAHRRAGEDAHRGVPGGPPDRGPGGLPASAPRPAGGHRGGSYLRRLKTRWGEIVIRVPRVAGGSYELRGRRPVGKAPGRAGRHRIRNALATCKRKNTAAVARSLRAIWAATTGREALAAVKTLEAVWWAEEERTCRTLERDLHECLSCLDSPEEDHKKIRTTNAMERAVRKVRRRTRPMGVYVNA
ncbi:MAG: hypothetical protein C4344_06215 [Acidimicrobiia bacterium]